MSAITLPKRYKILPHQRANAIAQRIGIKLNGEIRPLDVVEYDVEKGYIVTNKGERFEGVVEAFWR
jgi:hypothetical protein